MNILSAFIKNVYNLFWKEIPPMIQEDTAHVQDVLLPAQDTGNDSAAAGGAVPPAPIAPLPFEEQLQLVAMGFGRHPQVSSQAITVARSALLLRFTGITKEQLDTVDPEIMKYIYYYWGYTFQTGTYENVLY